MKKHTTIILLFLAYIGYAQNSNTYTKRVLENAEIDLISSFYTQDGNHAAVTGGIGTEELTDFASTITIAIPLNANDVFTVEASISAYTSASSSNLDPFDNSGASSGEDDDDDDDDDNDRGLGYLNAITGTPWAASSGASKEDTWISGNIAYNHASNDRNTLLGANINFASEYDYTSFGFGGNFTQLFNEKNTEVGVKANVFFDKWHPKYPTELDSYLEANQNLNNGFFATVDILNQNGEIIDKNGTAIWAPSNTALLTDDSRNTYAFSLSFSQILSAKAQMSIFVDLVHQKGWLANPMQRVYFADKNNFYIGNAANISNYTSSTNTDVFQLADDIERLPNTRFKLPLGMRFNYYLNENITLRTYYRYYSDDWGIMAHTSNIELPVKMNDKFTLYPSYRYYTQTAANYFAPYEQHNSTEEFYTSDFDLSSFNATQWGLGLGYTDIFTAMKLWKIGLKNAVVKYSMYKRNTGLKAGIVSAAFKFVVE